MMASLEPEMSIRETGRAAGRSHQGAIERTARVVAISDGNFRGVRGGRKLGCYE
jgi:hypothetical protein